MKLEKPSQVGFSIKEFGIFHEASGRYLALEVENTD